MIDFDGGFSINRNAGNEQKTDIESLKNDLKEQ